MSGFVAIRARTNTLASQSRPQKNSSARVCVQALAFNVSRMRGVE